MTQSYTDLTIIIFRVWQLLKAVKGITASFPYKNRSVFSINVHKNFNLSIIYLVSVLKIGGGDWYFELRLGPSIKRMIRSL